ncbi:hypothetical protein [Psychromarinibacter sp. S121]|uniref:hypothetical protein n=1 Tax=Psychromarinibacter sp. S121 TaxID=3415127 RepID=UPI003C79B98A
MIGSHHRERFGVDSPGRLQEFRARFERELGGSIRRAGPDDWIVMCCEDLFELRDVDEVGTLKALVGQFCDKTEIFLYIRRQDRALRSLYSTSLKNGQTRENVFPEPGSKQYATHDYARVLALWTEVFGAENIHLRIFEKDRLVGGDSVKDFLEVSGIAARTKGLDLETPRSNRSPDEISLHILREFNRRYPEGAMRGKFGEYLGDLFPGSGMPVTRAEAQDCLAHFNESNQKIAETYFDTAELFDVSDLDQLPDKIVWKEVRADNVIERFAQVWAARMNDFEQDKQRQIKIEQGLRRRLSELETEVQKLKAAAVAPSMLHLMKKAVPRSIRRAIRARL